MEKVIFMRHMFERIIIFYQVDLKISRLGNDFLLINATFICVLFSYIHYEDHFDKAYETIPCFALGA